MPFPPVSWWVMALASSAVELDPHEHYQKMSYRNRYYLAGPSGKQLLSLPLEQGRNQRRAMQAVKVLDSDWPLIHTKTIRSLYQRAPFYEHYAPAIFDWFKGNDMALFRRNRQSIALISRLLNLPLALEESTGYVDAPGPEYRDIRTSYRPQVPQPAAIRYIQVFGERTGFLPDCSILDLLFCEGKAAEMLLKQAVVQVR